MIRLNALQASSDFKSLREKARNTYKNQTNRKGALNTNMPNMQTWFYLLFANEISRDHCNPSNLHSRHCWLLFGLVLKKKETGITRNKHKNITKTSKTFCSYFREWITDQIVPHHYIIFRDYCTLGQKI